MTMVAMTPHPAESRAGCLLDDHDRRNNTVTMRPRSTRIAVAALAALALRPRGPRRRT